MQLETIDVVVIGAGPSGSVVASLLAKQDIQCLVLEKEQFPRFSIGESLLPQCMSILEEADLLAAVEAEQFQFKNGAAFDNGRSATVFDFTKKFSQGPGTTFQVERGRFDKALADATEAKGVPIRYQHQVLSIQQQDQGVLLTVRDLTLQQDYQVQSKQVLDASGFGRVLPRLLDLEYPSDFPVRHAYFAHFDDAIEDPSFDRNKILIGVHPQHCDVWYWLIPFPNGVASIGVVAEAERFSEYAQQSPSQILEDFIDQQPRLKQILANRKARFEARSLKGYSANVKSLYGDHFLLLGNAGEFLDPVFSSGVTIALKSAELAAPLVARKLAGDNVDWENEYSKPLKSGVDTFKTYVKAWYDGRFQQVIFYEDQDPKVRAMISSILAGYAWDQQNPFVAQSEKRLNTLVELCQG